MHQSHAAIGASWWLAAAAVTPAHMGWRAILGGTAVCAAAALAPDIDLKGSVASRSLGGLTRSLSWAIRKGCGGHRKITHSILGTVIFTALIMGATLAAGAPPWVGPAAVTGWCAHIAADCFTLERCPLLWPLSEEKFGIPLVRTGLKLVRTKGRVGRHHTSEWWVVRPAAYAAVLGLTVLVVLGL